MNPSIRKLRNALRGIVGPARVISHGPELALYGYDATLIPSSAELVVLPTSSEEVCATLRAAHRWGVPVSPRGAGTSLSGGPLPVEGGLVLCLTQMDRILRIDVPNRCAVVQPGVINADLQAELAALGCFYAPDPASQLASTIGGNVAENAGGPHCLKYGVVSNHTLGLRIALHDGREVLLDGSHHGGAGYDLVRAVVGSEGTFGVVTEITCRIMRAPETVRTMLASFGCIGDAAKAVSAIIAAGLMPAALEMMDRNVIRAVQSAMDVRYPEGAAAVLVIEADGLAVSVDRQVREIRAICDRCGAVRIDLAHGEAERQQLWRGRKGAMASLVNLLPNTLCTDVAVPRSQLPAMLADVGEVADALGVVVGTMFHAGDGNLHPQVLFDARDPEQVERAHRVDDEIVRLALAHGGVVSGEHGIGTCKRRWLSALFSEADLEAQRALRMAFDPSDRMNPGKVLPDAGRSGVGTGSSDEAGKVGSDSGTSAERLTYTPRDEAELAASVSALATARRPFVIAGRPNPMALQSSGPVVNTSGMVGIVNLDPENLSVSVLAGTRWSELQESLRDAGQFVPLRPPGGSRTTVGSVVAQAGYSPQQALYGACADLVLGLRFVLPTGVAVKSGGQCVKDVSGYALFQLLIGSHGTIGAITQVTFRTRTLPAAMRTLTYSPAGGDVALRAGQLRTLADEIWSRQLQPASLHAFLAGHDGSAPPWSALLPGSGADMFVVALEGQPEEVEYMEQELDEVAMAVGLAHTHSAEGAAHDSHWCAMSSSLGCCAGGFGAPGNAIADVDSLLAGLGRGGLSIDLCTGAIFLLPDVVSDLRAGATGVGSATFHSPDGRRVSPDEPGLAALKMAVKSALDPYGLLPDTI